MSFLISNRVGRSIMAVAVGCALASSLSACSETISLDSAPDANNPRCAALTVRVPPNINGNQQRTTDAQATSAWGNPVGIILRCGLPEVTASTLICTTVGGVDWLVDPSKAPSYRFITFGRKPATEVIVNYKKVSGVSTLDALAQSITDAIPVDRRCVDPNKD